MGLAWASVGAERGLCYKRQICLTQLYMYEINTRSRYVNCI
jgi:hypothetical protein